MFDKNLSSRTEGKQEMKCKVNWRVLFRVKSKETALKRLGKIEEALQQPLTIKECQKYWKLPEMFECIFTTSVMAEKDSDIVFEVLLMIQKIGYSWVINGPNILENGHVELDGVLDTKWGRILIAGVEWAHFDLYYEEPSQTTYITDNENG
jgi:hypothetical protein